MLDTYEDTQDMLQEIRLARGECPHCSEPLEHFSGLEMIPEHYYCPRCMDRGYDEHGQEILKYD